MKRASATTAAVAATLGFGFALAGCGQKGPLYLPDEGNVVIRPVPQSDAPPPPTQDAPGTPTVPDESRKTTPAPNPPPDPGR